jgi:hypothetical protein
MYKWGYQKIFNQQLLQQRFNEINKNKKRAKKQIINNNLTSNFINVPEPHLENKLGRTQDNNDFATLKNDDEQMNFNYDEFINNENFNENNALNTEIINDELKNYNILTNNNNSKNTDLYTEDINLENEFQKFEIENDQKNDKKTKIEIDVVYTWVNSNDPSWKNKKHQYQNNNNIKDGDNIGRYDNNNELLYSIRSVMKHLPWIRNIFIITDNQTPIWFNQDNPRIKIISHEDIFEDKSVLPVFNSVAIEMNLHRIPGLSEYFIYLNDDCLFGNNMKINDFITKNGKIIMRFQKIQFSNLNINKTDSSFRIGHKNASKLISKNFGHHPRLTVSHQAFILRKSIFAQLEKMYPNEINQTRANKFRSTTDVQPIALHNYFAQETGLGVGMYERDSLYYGIIDNTTVNDIRRVFNFIIHNRPKYICINDARKNRQNKDVIELIKKSYNYIYPKKSICEL